MDQVKLNFRDTFQIFIKLKAQYGFKESNVYLNFNNFNNLNKF